MFHDIRGCSKPLSIVGDMRFLEKGKKKKKSRSSNARYMNLISYRIKGDTSARPCEVTQQMKAYIYNIDIYL